MTAVVSILDADMATLGRWLKAGYAWWRQELAAMAPKRRARRDGAGIVARYSANLGFRLSRRGQPIERKATEKARTVPVSISLPPELCLVREVDYPALGEADLKRMVLLDAERLLPFCPGAALVDIELGGNRAAGRQQVKVATLPKTRAIGIVEAAMRERLVPKAIGIEGQGFDFLPALRAESAGDATAKVARFWWIVMAALFALNIGALIGRDMQNVASLRALVAEQGQAAGVARQIGQRVAGENARRTLILERREKRSPLTILALATEALPDGGWVQRYAWDGRTLRLAGYRQEDVDVLPALRREPAFANVRASNSDVPAQEGAGQPYDVTAELGGSPR